MCYRWLLISVDNERLRFMRRGMLCLMVARGYRDLRLPNRKSCKRVIAVGIRVGRDGTPDALRAHRGVVDRAIVIGDISGDDARDGRWQSQIRRAWAALGYCHNEVAGAKAPRDYCQAVLSGREHGQGVSAHRIGADGNGPGCHRRAVYWRTMQVGNNTVYQAKFCKRKVARDGCAIGYRRGQAVCGEAGSAGTRELIRSMSVPVKVSQNSCVPRQLI